MSDSYVTLCHCFTFPHPIHLYHPKLLSFSFLPHPHHQLIFLGVLANHIKHRRPRVTVALCHCDFSLHRRKNIPPPPLSNRIKRNSIVSSDYLSGSIFYHALFHFQSTGEELPGLNIPDKTNPLRIRSGRHRQPYLLSYF